MHLGEAVLPVGHHLAVAVEVDHGVPLGVGAVERAGQHGVAGVDVEPRARRGPAREEVALGDERVVEEFSSHGRCQDPGQIPKPRVIHDAWRSRHERSK